MRKITRNLLFGSTLLLFVVLAPLAIFYARGYVIDTKEGTIIKTGMISIKTNQPSVSVIVDDEPVGIKSNPILIKGLTPGKHRVELQKEGFNRWQADLPVVAEKVTQLGKILLALDREQPSTPISGELGAASVSTNAKYTIFSVKSGTDQGIWLHTSTKDRNRLLIKGKGPKSPKVEDIDKFIWSNNSKEVLVHDKNSLYYLLAPHVSRPKLVALDQLKGLRTSDILFSEDEPSTLFYRKGADLFEFRTSKELQHVSRIADKVVAFALISPKLFILGHGTGEQRLSTYDLRSPKDGLSTIVDGPEGQDGEHLLVSSGREVALITDQHNLLLLKKEKGQYQWVNTDQDVDLGVWSPDSRYLVYRKNTELWAYDRDALADEQSKFFITRFAKKPEIITWHPESNYLLMSLADAKGDQPQYELLYVSRFAPQTNQLNLPDLIGVPQIVGKGDNLFFMQNNKTKKELVIYPFTDSN